MLHRNANDANFMHFAKKLELEQESIPVACVPSAAVAVWGMSAFGRVSAKVDTPSPLWTESLTHACENITFPQLLLRTVINYILCVLLNWNNRDSDIIMVVT